MEVIELVSLAPVYASADVRSKDGALPSLCSRHESSMQLTVAMILTTGTSRDATRTRRSDVVGA